MKLVIYRDDTDEWRWHLVASNGRIVADSGEGYHNRGDCEDMARNLHPDIPVEVV